jgi:hypothetical protein
MCEKWSPIKMEEHRLSVSENKAVARRVGDERRSNRRMEKFTQ